MNRCSRYGLIAFLALPLLGMPGRSAAAEAPSQHVLAPDAAEAVKLAHSGVADEVVLAFIKKSPRTYDLSADDVLYLKNSGLRPAVLTAMLEHDQAIREQRLLASKPGPRPARRMENPPPMVVVVPATSPNVMERAAIPPAPKPLALTPAFRSKPAQPEPPKPPRSWTSSIIVEHAPPPPELEIQPLPPSPSHVWVPGHWTWRNAGWVWLRGEWIERPDPGMVWVDGHWAKHGRGFIWVPGHWRT